MASFTKKAVYNAFTCKEEPLELGLDEGQQADATQAYNDKFASGSLWYLGLLCAGHVVHVIVHSAKYSRRLPAVISSLMCCVTMLTVWLGLRLKRRRAYRSFRAVVSLPFVFHHLAQVPLEKWVSTLLFFKFNSFFSYLTPGPSDCDSFAACRAVQDGGSLANYCYTPTRVDAEQLWSILLIDVYHILMVLDAKTSLLTFIPALSMYILPVLSLGGILDGSGWAIVILTLIIALLCICTKSAKDSATERLMTLVEFQRKHIIKEKVKRCEAEFECDKLKDQYFGRSSNIQDKGHGSSVLSVTSEGQTQMSVPASAPATSLFPHNCRGNDADCLLETSRVYIEGAPKSLQELRELKKGQRVLCQDALTGSFEFVTVSEVKAETCPDEFIRLVLEDASILDMTADHPMPAFLAGSYGHSLEVVEAQKLLPGMHAVSTWKRMDLKIKEVSRVKPSSCQEECSKSKLAEGEQYECEPSELKAVAVSTQNPMRYKMLVAGPKGLTQPANAPAVVAVGFANLDVFNLKSRATFLEAEFEEPGPALRRTVSEPAMYDTSPGEKQTFTGSLPSAGSIGHATGDCKPCNIHNRYLNGNLPDPCKFGAACNFCHEHHVRKDRKMLKYIKRHQQGVQAL